MIATIRGYSLIELAVIIAVAGAVLVLGSSLYMQRTEQTRTVTNESLMLAANDALIGFIYSQERLPCPASGNEGIEDCSVSAGYFPYRSLGMAAPLVNGSGFALRYAHFDRPHYTVTLDAALAQAKDRYRPFYAVQTPAVAQPQEMGTINALDFCQALVIGGNVTPTQSLLNVSEADGSAFTNVAYVLINPGAGDRDDSGSVLDGLNSDLSSDTPTVEHPSRQTNINYDDRVYAAYFNQLSQQLGCVNVMTPANAHANAVTAATVMQQAMMDYKVQLEFAEFLAGADMLGATADTLAALADGAIVVSDASTAISTSINTAGSLSGALVGAAVAAGLAVIGGALAAVGMAEATAALVLAEANVSNFVSLQQELDTLQLLIQANLESNNQAGIYD